MVADVATAAVEAEIVPLVAASSGEADAGRVPTGWVGGNLLAASTDSRRSRSRAYLTCHLETLSLTPLTFIHATNE